MTARDVVPFKRWHLLWLLEDGPAAGGMGAFSNEMLTCMERNGWTATYDGAPVGCGGLVMHWPGRHMAWVYLNANAGPHMLFITRAVRRVLDNTDGRIEMTVREDFDAGHRWAKLLGFQVETEVLRAYGPEGESHVGYVRIN